MAMTTILTAAERQRLVNQFHELNNLDASIFYRDALDDRSNDQIQHELDALYERIEDVMDRLTDGDAEKIGRASCRERVGQYVAISVADGALKNTNKTYV